MLVFGGRLKRYVAVKKVSAEEIASRNRHYLGRESGARECERGHGTKDGEEGEDSGEHFD
jgi:hypothetical protein